MMAHEVLYCTALRHWSSTTLLRAFAPVVSTLLQRSCIAFGNPFIGSTPAGNMAALHTHALLGQASLNSAAQYRPSYRVSSAHTQAKLATVPSAFSHSSSLLSSRGYATSSTTLLTSTPCAGSSVVQASRNNGRNRQSSTSKRQAAREAVRAGQAALLSSPSPQLEHDRGYSSAAGQAAVPRRTPVQPKLASQYSSAAGQEALHDRIPAEDLTGAAGIDGLIEGIKVSLGAAPLQPLRPDQLSSTL